MNCWIGYLGETTGTHLESGRLKTKKWEQSALVNDQSEIVQSGPAKNGRIRLLNTANDSNNEKCGSISDEYK